MDMIGANGPAGAGELVKDGSDQGFMADVIEPSKEVPVRTVQDARADHRARRDGKGRQGEAGQDQYR